MPIKSVIRKGDYRDSVVLMRVSKELESFPGVTKASVMMGTSSNKELLKQAGILTKEAEAAGPNDLVIVAEASDEKTLAAAIAHAEKLLMEEVQVAERELAYKTVEAAIGGFAEADLVLISTPGQFAAREAMKALRAGKHVMIFSSDVPIEEEVKLKRFASERGLLVMGPDCGTAIVGGVGLGFSNIVGRGPVGIVGAAGTGIQEVSSLLDEVGITSAIGTGSHDPSDAVGAITMISGLKALEEDENTKVIVLISKPPSPAVARKVMETVRGLKKPVVVDFIGGDPKIVVEAGGIPAKTLEDAALKAISILKGKRPKERKFTLRKKTLQEIVKRETEKLLPTQKYIRGLFSGGTLCAEAQLLLRELVGDVHSNVPLEPRLKLDDVHRSVAHTCVDMGTEDFVRGVPHPMIDFRFRRERIIREARDPETAVILLDVVLGIGANPDPAGELSPAIKEAKEIAAKEGRYLPVVASITGTSRDPQRKDVQKKKLEEVGVVVMPSNAQATRLAALIATRGEVWEKL